MSGYEATERPVDLWQRNGRPSQLLAERITLRLTIALQVSGIARALF